MASTNIPKSFNLPNTESLDTDNPDLLIRNAYVVTMDSNLHTYPHGAVAIKNRDIVWIGPDEEIDENIRSSRTINAHGAVVHPGFIDTHVHLIYHTIRWADNDSADFNQAMSFSGDFLDAIDDEVEHAGTRLACLELAQNGTTCFLEANVINTDGAVSAIQEIGIRAMIGDPAIKDLIPPNDTFGSIKVSSERSFSILGNHVKRYSNPDGLIRGVVTLSAMGTASDELLLTAKSIADENGVILNMHQSYARDDTESDDLRLGRHPLVHYRDIGLLGKNCTFAHMNFVREDEFSPILESGMSIAWCPIASMMYGIGGTLHGNHLELYKAGANIALGSDSANWTSSFNIGQQALLAVLTAREKTGRSDALGATDVLKMATVNGAQAAGMSNSLGSLEVGKKADLVIRKEDLSEAHPGSDPIRSLIYSSGSKSIDTVIVNGEIIIKNGHSTRVDEKEVYAKVRESSDKVLQRMGK